MDHFFEQVAQKCRDGGTSDRMNSTSARSSVPLARHMFASAQLTACVERNTTRCIARAKDFKALDTINADDLLPPVLRSTPMRAQHRG